MTALAEPPAHALELPAEHRAEYIRKAAAEFPGALYAHLAEYPFACPARNLSAAVPMAALSLGIVMILVANIITHVAAKILTERRAEPAAEIFAEAFTLITMAAQKVSQMERDGFPRPIL